MMSNPFDELTAALSQAREMRRAVKQHGEAMLQLLDGNLHGLSTYYLKRIKTQLRDFNMHTEEWK